MIGSKLLGWVRRVFGGQATAADRPWQPTHQHRKGGLYRVVGRAILEADRSDVVIYDDADGTVWVRSAAEFEDGRFRPVSVPLTG